MDSVHAVPDSALAGLPSSIGVRDSLVINENEPSVRVYLEFFQKEPRKANLPEELWLLPVIESEYRLFAKSTAKAVGLWQFIAPTAMKYGWFKDWPLALAAYNKEIKDYVPQVYATVLIARDPEKYGFSIPQSKPVDADTLVISYTVDLAVAAKAVGTTQDELERLNPELRGG